MLSKYLCPICGERIKLYATLHSKIFGQRVKPSWGTKLTTHAFYVHDWIRDRPNFHLIWDLRRFKAVEALILKCLIEP